MWDIFISISNVRPNRPHIICVLARIFLLAIVLLQPQWVAAQRMTDTLHEVNVRKKKDRSNDSRLNHFSEGQKITTIDSITLQQYKMQSVAQLLAQQGTVFIKSYGLNGLATLNIRGSSAAQSQVYWNGVPINNAALGMADVSLLPVFMMHKLHLVYGSSGALWGSGNVGGALMLESDAPTFLAKPQYEVAIGAGSFGQYQGGGKLTWSRKRFFSGTNVFTQTARNDFPFENDWGGKGNMSNAQLRGLALQQQFAYRLGEHHSVRVMGWYQNYYREIPPALFEPYSGKIRKDESLRTMLDWNKKSGGTHTYLRLAWLQDNMRFADDTINLSTRNNAQQGFLEAGLRQRLGERHQLLVFAPLQVARMVADTSSRQQTRYALALAYSYRDAKDRFSASANLRGEIIDSRKILLPGIGAAYRLNSAWQLRANIQRTFRVPTLNELYFYPGGNANLRPEHGWSSDLGYRVEAKHGRLALVHDMSVYRRLIHDWIIWFGGAIWTPHNIASVRSSGIESENYISFKLNTLRLHLGLNAAYVAATTVTSHIPLDGSIGKQIPYTPNFSGQINAGITWQTLYLNYNHSYTGLRYVNMDETGALAAFSTGNLQLAYSFRLQHHQFSVSAQANNLWDARYQVMNARPMPGRNWLLALRLSSL